MSTVSKEILDKLRQLSDLLVVIKDSGNNTPQILKELAVEKCSEIYSSLSSEEEVIEYKIVDTPKAEIIEELIVEDEPTEEVFNNYVEEEEQLNEPSQREEESEIIELPTITIEEEINNEEESQEVEVASALEIESVEEEDTQEEEAEVFDTKTDSFEENEIVEIEEEEILINEEDDEEVDLFATKDSFKKCNHKKIRSVLSINDIFLYKRELFGNSDVDMTDMFDGIDESESFEDAMELISEYFGSDVDTEELVIEFVERVKQCFE